MLALLLALSCTIPEDPNTASSTAEDQYFTAWCRLYTRPRCVNAQLETCDWAFEHSFDTLEECTGFLRFNASDCGDLADRFLAEAATVTSCVDQMKAHDCQGDAFCDEGGLPIDENGDCVAVKATIDEVCPNLYGRH